MNILRMIQVSLVKECMWKKFYNSKWVKWAIKQIFLIPLIVVFKSIPIHKHKLVKLPPPLSNIL